MEYDHKPVLLTEVLQQFSRTNIGGTFVDCTLGGAGHAKAILENFKTTYFVLGIDQDITAINTAKQKLQNFSQHFLLLQGNFRDIDKLLKGNVTEVAGFLFDLGVSSMHFDIAERGFSYQKEGPLDMRMDKNQRLSAYDVVSQYSQKDLSMIIKQYGEERWASRIADFIVKERQRQPIKSTSDLVKVIKNAIPASARRKGGHPARRTFQALRIEVNDELKALESALWQAIKWLKKDGKIVVISYHSLEDRITKRVFKKMQDGYICKVGFTDCKNFGTSFAKVITKKPIVPSKEEIKSNPRARSAKLRVLQKI